MTQIQSSETRSGSARDGANRRAAFRIEVSCAVVAVIASSDTRREPGARELVTVTEDVSMSGVRLRLPKPLEAGTALELQIEVAGEVAVATAKVMHSRADHFGAFAGVNFVNIDPQTRARLTRFIAAEERRRLPNVRVMYAASCSVAGESTPIEGSTQECTPGFVRLLLQKPVAPTSHVAVTVSTAGRRLRLDGHVVGCQPAGELWSTGVRLAETDAAATATWTALVTDLRSAVR